MNKQSISTAAAAVVDDLAGRASERAGLDDFGGDSWREGLGILVDTVESTPGASPENRADLHDRFVDALWNRLRVVEYRKQHPEVAEERIERPLVILGMPRTGTTVASYLLDQDPARRSLLNWEAADSVPPATTATLRTDPRCLAKAAELEALADMLIKAGMSLPHWEDADGPTECIFVQNQDFKAFLWDAFMPNSRYSDWLTDTADMTSAYEYQRSVLQILQSHAPGTWSLKMPSHAVHIDTLLATFPDARIIWAHRDPFKATASLVSIQQASKARLGGPDFDVSSVAPAIYRQMQAHVGHALRARKRIGDDRFFDLHYLATQRDPIGQMHELYDWAGDTLTPEVEKAMLGWLERSPATRFPPRPYTLEGLGITKAEMEPLFEEYLDTFDVELEP